MVPGGAPQAVSFGAPPAVSFGAPPPVPGAPSMMSQPGPPMMGGQPPMMGGQPPMMGGQPPMMGGQPPMMGGQPPMMGGLGRPGGGLGGAMPPPMVSPPPMMSPGSLSGPPAVIVQKDGPKVLVGFLVTFQNDPSGSFWPLHSGKTQLGRSAADGVEIALQDASASSRHASIHADPATGQAFAEDDGSRNGTFLNEARLAPGERRQLRDNDRLRLGSTTFVVKLLVS
jgi:hypothetical protein